MDTTQAHRGANPPQAGSADAEEPLSARAKERRRRAAGLVAERAIAALRPNAPLPMIERLVASRCVAAGLPTPSRTALIAHISQVRRYGVRDVPVTTNQLTLDHVLIETRTLDGRPAVATLSVAVLDPPGVVVVWDVSSGRPLAEVEAGILAPIISFSAERNTRIELPAGSDPDGLIETALRRTSVKTIRSLERERGAEAMRILGRQVAGRRLRRRGPRGALGAVAADQAAVDLLRDEIAPDMARQSLRRGRRKPVYGFVNPFHARALHAELLAIACGEAER
jgi:hypothetical protein